MKLKLLIISLIFTSFFAGAQTTHYVKTTATGSGDGSSWANASGDLQAKINAAAVNDQIFVNKGEYILTASIVMKEGVKIYGSFSGTETTLSARNLTNFSNDANNATILKSNGNQRVITNNFTEASPITSASVLDGFVITGGGNTQNGGGMYNNNASPILHNLIITGNTAQGVTSQKAYGGGMYNAGFSSPKLTNVIIKNNNANGGSGDNFDIGANAYGGGIYNANTTSPKLINVIISNNNSKAGGGIFQGDGYGGGMYNANTSSPVMTNVTFAKNTMRGENGYGGGMYNETSSTPTLTNTILLGNTFTGFSYSLGIHNDNNSITITYSIVQGMAANATNNNLDGTTITTAEVFTDAANGDYSLKDGSSVINAGDNTSYTSAGGDLLNDTDLSGNKRVYQNTIDIGAYESQTAIITPDANNILYVNKTATGEAFGDSWANAIPELADALKWAKQNYNASWATTPLKIFVAKGTYKPLYSPEDGANFGTNQYRDNTFLMVNNVQIYGGFAGTETTLVERDLSLIANKSTLSGDFGPEDVVAGFGSTLSITKNETNVYHVVISTGNVGTARLDGFTISGGNANGTTTLTVNSNNFYRNIAGGIYNHNTASLFTNLIVSGNTANGGGGIYNDNSNIIVTKVNIKQNMANFGGGIYNDNSNSTLTNVIFNGNKAKDGSMPETKCADYSDEANCIADSNCIWWGICIQNVGGSGGTAVSSGFGGGLYNKDSSPIITNVTFSKNLADVNGGGIYNKNSFPKIYNSLLIGNTATTSDSGIFNETSTPVIKNSLIQDLTDTTNGNIDATGLSDIAIFKDPVNGDYTLKNTSPAVNAGDNSLYTGTIGTDKDLAGNPRLFVDPTTTDSIDMGAYELQEDVTAPTITMLSPADDATNIAINSNLEITFNENVTKGTGNIVIYDADNNVVETIDVTTEEAVSITDATVTINPTTDLANNKSYYVQIATTAFKDAANNAYTGITDKTTWSFTTIKPIANIVISEIMYNPPESGTDEYEYIELYNAGTTTVDLTGYSFSEAITHTFTTGSIAAGDYFVIAGDYRPAKLDEAFGAGTTDANWTDGALSNSREEIILKDNFNRVVDYVDYDTSSPWPQGRNIGEPNGGGTSIELRDLTSDNNVGSNWSSSTDPRDIRTNAEYGKNLLITGTPGLPAIFIKPNANNILYVNKAATITGVGDSWANAIPELADALKWAKQNEKVSWATTPLKIFVAKGTYKPMYSPEDGANFGTDQGRNNSFLMVNNVQIYGGFVGTETNLSDRDLSLVANKTILSGDFDDDDIVSGSGSTLTITNNTENANHVIISSGNVGTARLDGFTISGGNADDTTFSKIVINGNNINLGYGGGLSTILSSPIISNAIITGNTGYYGGGIYNGDSSATTIINSLIVKNKSIFYGGGILNAKTNAVKIINITLLGNKASTSGDGIYNVYLKASTILENSIVWDAITNASSVLVAKNSIIKGSTNTTNGNIDATNLTAAILFKDVANGDYTLKSTSPAVNAGNNTLYTGTISTDKDLAGNPRLYDGLATTDIIDMGAYELQENPFVATPTTNFATQVYAGDDKTLADLEITGTNIKYYDAISNGNVLVNTTLLADNTTYYASQTIKEVESQRISITVKRIADANQNVATGSTVADLVSTPTTGSTATWYSAATGGTALNSTEVLTTATYYIAQTTPLALSIATLGSGFNTPAGVAVQSDGKILVADPGSRTIKRMNADGTNVVTLVSGLDAYGVAVQSNGKILVAVASGNAIKRMDADGTNVVTLGSGFTSPTGVAVQSDGKILVADGGNNTIKRMDADGSNIVTLGSGFTNPSGVAVQSDGKILVADGGNKTIKRMDADGSNMVTLGSGFNYPTGVAVQSDGKILVADYGNDAIKRMDADGTNVVTLGSGFSSPYGVTIQSDGKILVADAFSNAIKRITEASTTNRVAVTVNLPPTITTLSPANDATNIAIDSNLKLTFNENVTKGTGNIVIYDADNNVVETIDVTTSAVSITNKVVTINPTNDLKKSKSYYVQVANTAFKDGLNNAFEGVSDTTTWSFATVLKVAPTFTFADFSKTYGDADFDLAATSNSTGIISYEIISGGTGSATLSETNNKKVSLGNVGTVTIKATVAADADYLAKSKTITLTINKAELTVTADDKNREYGEANPTLTFTYSGFKNTDNASDLIKTPVATTSATANTNIGTYDIAVALPSAKVSSPAVENYSFKFVKGTLTINKAELTVTADDKNREYGEANPTLTFTYAGFKNTDDASNLIKTPVASTSATANTDIGTYDIVVALPSAKVSSPAVENYSFKFVKGTLTINKAELTVTADDKNREYGEANPTLTFTYSGFKNTDDASNLIKTPVASTFATANTNIGTYDIIVALPSAKVSSPAVENYSFKFVKGTLTINKAELTVTADDKNREYGEVNPTLTFTYSGFKNTDDASNLIKTPVASTFATANTNVGTYDIVVALPSAKVSSPAVENYSFKFVKGTLTITQKAITITAVAKSKVYGETDAALTYTVSPSLVTGDVLTGSLARATGENVGVYAIEIGTLSAGNNYSTTFVSANLTITKATITGITFADKNIVFDGTAKSLSIAGTLPSGTSVSYANNSLTNVGTQEVTATISGANYNDLELKADLTITKATITGITFVDASSVFDGTAKSLSITGTLPTGTSVSYANNSLTNVGTQEVTATISGANYNDLELKADLIITKATQIITFDALTHDDKDVFDLTATASSGLDITYSSSDTSVATISGNTITVLSAGSTEITATQSGNNNYEAATNVSQTLTITVLGVNDNELVLSEILLYPNPTTNFIKIDLKNIVTAKVQIYDVIGKLILNVNRYNSNEMLDTSSLKAGVYLVKIKADNKEITKRIVKD